MLKHWKGTLALLSVVAAVALVSAGLALGKKPPKPPPEPPPPDPTVSYSIQFLGTLPGQTLLSVNDLNNHGEVVGRSVYDGGYSAFLYTPAGGNSSGDIVGISKDGTTKDPMAQPQHGFPYTNKTDTGEFVMVKLEDPDLIVNLPADLEGYIEPDTINDSGQICGKIVVEGTAPTEAVLLTPWP